MDSWEGAKRFYKIMFNIPEKVLEYVAVFSVLTDCVVGYANYKIAKRNRTDINYVESVIFDFFHFDGWRYDLDISPLAVYNKVKGNYLAYENEIQMMSNISELNMITSFNVCEIYTKMKGLIKKYYDYS